ncbi:DUF3833 domain-containing protein [Eilatimonas milleporae]|uniref:Uncharacterized protein DUF3833 n=1 Tax=Eilatimonas milleporae TaxID=911205 RepID=A0A3M0CHE2_9PROT|nr:DUF3833 domain-containing protein [Eilatimonas milleporae]RMB07940.1 uncharacterized protein DUF3833 [Eilatimonas milleporae]
MKASILLIAAALLLSACSKSIDGSRYLDDPPTFDLYTFFDGEVKAWGIVQDRSGDLLQRFEVDIDGSVADGVLTLDETFAYSLGEGVEKRIWTIRETAEGTYEGMADDIAGPATGTAYGNAVYWRYEMDLPVGDSEYRVAFKDWIWAFDDRTIVNRSYIQKFGLVMAEVTLFMQKQG